MSCSIYAIEAAEEQANILIQGTLKKYHRH